MLRKRFSFLTVITLLLVSLVFIPVNSVSAEIADGTYQIQYEVKQKGSNNTSIADGYFIKPATLTVSGGTQTIQLSIKDAHYVKSLSVQGTPVTVVSDDGSNRVVKFNVSGDLSNRVPMSMHIKVPDLYDTTHGADAVFHVSGLAKTDGGASATGDEKVVDNPKTGDSSPIYLYVILLIGGAGALVLVRKLRPAGQ